MRRRKFLGLVGGAAAAWPLFATAQEPGRIYRLGMLWPFPRKTGGAFDNVINAFVDQMRQRGFIEGENLTIDYRTWALQVDLISEYAVGLIKAKVDVVATGGDLAIRAAQQATKTIPILAIRTTWSDRV